MIGFASARAHLLHHARFYIAAFLGLVIWLLLQIVPLSVLPPPLPILLAGDAFFAIYLVLTMLLALYEAPSRMRQRASVEDEGFGLIAGMTLVAVALSIGSIFILLNRSGGEVSRIGLWLSVANVPLGWLTLHMAASFHYAHLYYARVDDKDGKKRDAGGLKFPGGGDPIMWDFLYFSFVVGMTAQVSDVQTLTTEVRRLTLFHGIVSFFFNTVLLALAVNIVVAQAH
ncbi:membrane protein [Hypericibacter terrae]|uniref:Membrane protein n=1 Tax=Hypericibacter terrae TaxID=2602015 RepID=A0A5J6MHN1_9PROT|nr:DUF1345 domain-containing protein [Hypericibacter terrae]QEX16969.1 membrane protein [Hypericibacter terrae]